MCERTITTGASCKLLFATDRLRDRDSKTTFDKLQAALVTVGKPRKNRGEWRFLFLNFAARGTCGQCVTGERHTKSSGRR